MPTKVNTNDSKWRQHGSIIRLKKDENLFLSYSDMLISGPPIVRNGIDSPYMDLIDQPGQITTIPEEQRWLSWYIDEDSKNSAWARWRGRTDGTANWTLGQWGRHVIQLPVHTSEFTRRWHQTGRELQIVGQQGAGDLTMNMWNVAYINSAQSENLPVLICLNDEPLNQRQYSCLVKDRRTGTVSIEQDLQFCRTPRPGIFQKDHSLSNEVEFAVFGKQVIRDGRVVDFIHVVDQFSDIRHLLQLPNLNPRDTVDLPEDKDPRLSNLYTTRPRLFFGEMKDDDVWMGEAQILSDRNLKRSALKMPVQLNVLYEGLGAPRALVKTIMEREDYHSLTENMPAGRHGRFRFLKRNPAIPGNWMEVWLKENGYPCTMIGVDRDNQTLYLLAYDGGYWNGPGAKSIREVAEDFIEITEQAGAKVDRALLVDEGGDVFQKADFGSGLESTVKKKREQLRCCFIVAKEVSSSEN